MKDDNKDNAKGSGGGGHVTTYYVDNEPQETTERELTVRAILTNAGFDPEQHYLVELRGSEQIPHKDINETLKIHEKEKFVAIFTGPTPVSAEGSSWQPNY